MSRLFGNALMKSSYALIPSALTFFCASFPSGVSDGSFDAFSVFTFVTRSCATSRAAWSILGFAISSWSCLVPSS